MYLGTDQPIISYPLYVLMYARVCSDVRYEILPIIIIAHQNYHDTYDNYHNGATKHLKTKLQYKV